MFWWLPEQLADHPHQAAGAAGLPAGLPHPRCFWRQPDPPEGGGPGGHSGGHGGTTAQAAGADGPVLPGAAQRHPGPAPVFPVEPTVDTGAYLGPDETAVASWVQKNNKHAGAPPTPANAKCLYLAVRGEGSALAVAGIAIEEGREPTPLRKT